MRLDGKIAMVTGAASGIGAATAEAMAASGADLALIDINEKGLLKLRGALSKYDRVIKTYTVDVTDYDIVQKAGKKIFSDFKKVDILVNCAGGGKDAFLGFRELDLDSWDRQIKLNLDSTFYCTKVVIEKMIEQKSGKIINFSSVAGLRGGGMFGRGAYSTAKAGIVGLTKALARELGPYGIHVNAIAPGLHITPLTEINSKEALKAVEESLPLRCSGQPSKLAQLVVFLASDNAQFITGSVITVDGGFAMH